MKSSKITLINLATDKVRHVQGRIGMLMEYAPDSEVASLYPDVISLDKLLGKQEITNQLACELTKKILLGEPEFRGVPQLSVFQEQVSWELNKIYRSLHLYNFLLQENIDVCEFVSESYWGHELEKIVKLLDAKMTIVSPKKLQKKRYARIFKRLLTSRFSKESIKIEINNALDQLHPFRKRNAFKRKTKPYQKNKTWFYTTAVTFTNIGLYYECCLSEPLNYLVENELAGGKPLHHMRRPFHSLYQFSRDNDAPTTSEINHVKRSIINHINQVKLNSSEELVRTLFIKSDWFSTFTAKLLPKGLFFSALFKNWVETVKPSAVIVGNLAFEGYALYQAKKHKIPSILLQHGTLGDTYTYFDHPVNYYIVRGQFWSEQLSTASQQRSLVVNPVNLVKQNTQKKNSIVFLTIPFEMREMPIGVDFDSVIKMVLTAMIGSKKKLIIRVHPLERIEDYRNKIASFIGNDEPVEIEYDQHTAIQKLLNISLAVIMLRSTVFLDCIQHEVPIISFDWHDHWFKKKISQHGVFYFAKNLKDLCKIKYAML